MIRKTAAALAVILAFTLIASSCGEKDTGSNNSNDTSKQTESGPRTITGMDGSSITVPATVNKIVSLSPSATAILTGMGSTDKIIGIDEDSAMIEAASAIAASDAAGAVSLAPDLVFADENDDTSAIEKAGIAVVKIGNADSIAKIKNIIRLVGKAVNNNKAAESMVTSMTNAINVTQVQTSGYTNKYSVYFELGTNETFGAGVFVSEAINAGGGKNIFMDKSGYISVTDDEIIAANPQVIFTVGKASDITSRAGWENIDAVKNGRVYEVSEIDAKYPSQNVVSLVQVIFENIETARGN